MQNFTLGKRGIPMLLFALILLTSSFPSFGQENCPTEADTPAAQTFCYLQTVGDIDTDGNAIYRRIDSANPIPSNELLQSGTYYVGNQNGNCETRIPVNVTVDDAGAPTTQFGNTFAPCEYDEADISTVQDLIDNVDASTEEGETVANEIEIFATEFGETAMDPNTRLIEGDSYFAGQINRTTGCRTSRIALRYDPVFAPAPTAEDTQTFCEGATVADLQAQATSEFTRGFRWYSTATSQPALSSTTELIDGATYYVSQIVNRGGRNQPPCESRDRYEVTIEVIGNDAPVAETQQAFCQENNPTVADLEATGENLTWYVDTELTTVADENAPLVDGEDFFVTQTIASCESEATQVNVTIEGSPDAGDNFTLELCQNEMDDLVAFYNANPQQAEAMLAEMFPNADSGGSFSNDSLAEIVDQYSSANAFPFNAATTYTVRNTAGCEDSSNINIIVYESPDAGEDASIGFDREDDPVDLFDFLGGSPDTGGTWSPGNTDGSFDPSTDPEGVYTYSVGSGDCQDSATVTVTVEDDTVENDGISVSICSDEIDNPTLQGITTYYLNQIALYSDLPNDGTFDPSMEELLSQYEVNPIGTFTTNYTVNADGGVVTIQVSAEVVQSQEANAGEIDNMEVENTSTEVIVLDDSILSEDATRGGTFTAADNVLNEEGNFDPAIGPGVYSITYVVDESINCVQGEDSTTFTITVNEETDENDDISVSICSDEIDNPTLQGITTYYLNQIALYSDLPNDGSFDPSMEELLAQYEANQIGTFTTNYTVNADGGVVTIQVSAEVVQSQEANAGEIDDMEVENTSTEVIVLDDSILSEDATRGGTFTAADNVLNEEGNFDPAIGPGVYSITYVVDESINCVEGEDSTTFTITVNEETDENDDISVSICSDEIDNPGLQGITTYYLNQIALYSDLPNDGSFDPSMEELLAQYEANPIGTFTTNYTVNADGGVVTIQVSAEVVQSQEANAGEIDDITVNCDSTEIIVLDETILNEDATTGGVFTAAEGVLNEDGNFDPAVGEGEYVITYTVDESINCVQGEDTTSFTIIVQSAGNAGRDIDETFCISEINALVANPAEAANFFNNLIADQGGNVDTTGDFDATINDVITYYLAGDFSQPFTTLYRVGEGNCRDEAMISVTIMEEQEANAGEIENITVSCGVTEIIVLNNSILSEDATPGGEFTAAEGVLNEEGNFDPAIGTGEYLITYTVTESSCVDGEDSTTFTITVTGGNVTANDILVQLCEDEINNPTVNGFSTYYRNLVRTRANLPTNGTFNPGMETLVAQYQENPIGIITTNYTVSTECGPVSIEVSVQVNAIQEANAGENVNLTFCTTEGEQNLFSFLTEGANTGGSFDGYENGIFNPSVEGAGTYVITYTVDESVSCITGTATATLTVEVTDGDANAGADNSVERCNADVRSLSTEGVRNLYLSLLEPGVATNGTFNPTINEIMTQYNIVSNYGDFTTTYTVGDGDCQDSAVLTVTVLEANDAGADMDLLFCSTETSVNLFDFLSPYASQNGTFAGYEDGMFDPATATIGETTITYEVEDDQSLCSTGNFTSTFTITVNEPQDANAGGDVAVNYCIDSEEVDLYSLLGEGALLTGSFTTPYEDGMFNPASAGEGEYTITYTVDESSCAIGTDTATITINVGGTVSETPVADAEQFFCLSEGATVANLVATGDNVVWYTDADLTTEADATTPLVNDAVYYVTATSEGACAPSEAVMVTITLEDSVAPTIPTLGNEFCRQDNPTVQNLISRLNGSDVRVYTTSTGGTALANTTALENGITYYASSTDASVGCESTERLPVNVIVGFCGIPEGFSPNGDNINDRFVIPNVRRDYPNYNIEIYNRWGNLVYRGNQDWDGVSNQSSTLGDNVLPAGVYFYILNYNDGQTSPVQGKVYLSR